MSQALRKLHVRFARRKLLSSAYILNPPILSQLDIMLPPIILQNICISWSTRENHTNFGSLEGHIQTQTAPAILLISGRKQNQQRILFGIFDSKKHVTYGILEKPFIFQLAPLHRTYRPLPSETDDPVILGHNEDPTLDMLRYQSGNACLSFSESSGHFSVRDNPALDEFHVDAVELYQCDIEYEAEYDLFDPGT